MSLISQPYSNCTTKKADLLRRFRIAREAIGPRWRSRMAAQYPFYDTRQGQLIMASATDALRHERYISVAKLEPLVIAMESILEPSTTPVS